MALEEKNNALINEETGELDDSVLDDVSGGVLAGAAETAGAARTLGAAGAARIQGAAGAAVKSGAAGKAVVVGKAGAAGKTSKVSKKSIK